MQHIKRLFVVFSLLISTNSFSQAGLQDSIAHERGKLNQTHAYILGAWAAANIVQGSISASNATGSDRYFFRMNAYWNTVNLAIAGVGLLTVRKQLAKHYTLAGNLREQQKIENLLLLNTGLDAAYIMTGLYLKERGARLNNEEPRGYGSSLMLQGGFLLVFDIIQYAAHRRNGKLLESEMGKWQLGSTGNGLGLSYKL